MSDEEFDAMIGDARERLAHAQAFLDLFEKDCGRRATTAAEVREWADARDPEHLHFRMERHLMAGELWAAACKRIWKSTPTPLISRPPTGQRIFHTLAEAAETTGTSESEIITAVEAGRLTGTKDMLGEWHIERAELHRVFPPVRRDAAATVSSDDRALDATSLVLEVEIAAAIRQAGDSLRQRRPWWGRLAGWARSRRNRRPTTCA